MAWWAGRLAVEEKRTEQVEYREDTEGTLGLTAPKS